MRIDTPAPELKPCPHCGGDAIETEHPPHDHSPLMVALTGLPGQHPGSWSIECSRCSCGMLHATRDEARTSWNRRTPPASAQSVEPVALYPTQYAMVIDLLIAAGHCSHYQVNQARAIAAKSSTTPPSTEGARDAVLEEAALICDKREHWQGGVALANAIRALKSKKEA